MSLVQSVMLDRCNDDDDERKRGEESVWKKLG